MVNPNYYDGIIANWYDTRSEEHTSELYPP
jgi:hypothetical protein